MRVTAFLNAYSEGMSGGDACFIQIAKRQCDWELTIVTSALGRDLCREGGLDARFIILSQERRFHRPLATYVRRTLRGLLRPQKELGADVYYATSDFLPDTLLARHLRRRNPKSVWVQKSFHLIPPSRMIPHYAQKSSFHLIRNSADRVIVDNSLLKYELVERGFDPERVGVNYPGIDSGYFARLHSRPQGLYEAVFLARLVPTKGVFDLVTIWKYVVRRHPTARLAIVGRGSPSVTEELRAQIRCEGLGDRIHLLGYLSNDQAYATLKASLVFLFPSYEEGFGIAALEAIASGLPVVAYDLPVFSEVFPVGMLRVPIGDTAQFAGTVCRLLEDTALREDIVTASSGLPQQFDWKEVATREAEEIARAREQARCS